MASQAKPGLQGNSAFHGIQAVSHPHPEGGKPGLVIEEVAFQGKLNLRCDGAFHKEVTKIVGFDTNAAPNRMNKAGERYAVWLGPDEVMLLVEAGAEAALAQQINDAGSSTHMAVTDITDAMTTLKLSGDSIRAVLAKGCALDLHKDHFKAGDVAQTILSHAGVTLICCADDSWLVLCRTSFTDYLVSYLADASLGCGCQVKA